MHSHATARIIEQEACLWVFWGCGGLLPPPLTIGGGPGSRTSAVALASVSGTRWKYEDSSLWTRPYPQTGWVFLGGGLFMALLAGSGRTSCADILRGVDSHLVGSRSGDQQQRVRAVARGTSTAAVVRVRASELRRSPAIRRPVPTPGPCGFPRCGPGGSCRGRSSDAAVRRGGASDGPGSATLQHARRGLVAVVAGHVSRCQALWCELLELSCRHCH